ncbi:MAG: ATP-binding cassette domain-containing protein [Planctomycetia bacterium]|nr:ATP-binding cassette domain-containing protein [Planctomycetia bacterium]
MNAIEIQNASVLHDGRAVLQNISWRVASGEKCFLLGPNGAGKTTLVKLLLGYIWPRFGAKVAVLGKTFGEVNLHELRREIAWVSPFVHQWMQNPRLTGMELVASGLDSSLGMFRDLAPQEEARVLEVLALLSAQRLATQTFRTMSSGEQVKTLIARALICEPKLMILDEPNVYLDISGREFLLRTIAELAQRKPELTMIFITQRIEDVLPLFSHGVILKDGQIVAEGAREKILTEENICRTFDMNLRLVDAPRGRIYAIPQE